MITLTDFLEEVKRKFEVCRSEYAGKISYAGCLDRVKGSYEGDETFRSCYEGLKRATRAFSLIYDTRLREDDSFVKVKKENIITTPENERIIKCAEDYAHLFLKEEKEDTAVRLKGDSSGRVKTIELLISSLDDFNAVNLSFLRHINEYAKKAGLGFRIYNHSGKEIRNLTPKTSDLNIARVEFSGSYNFESNRPIQEVDEEEFKEKFSEKMCRRFLANSFQMLPDKQILEMMGYC